MEDYVTFISKYIHDIQTKEHNSFIRKGIPFERHVSNLLSKGYIKDFRGRDYVYYNPTSQKYILYFCGELSKIQLKEENGRVYIQFTHALNSDTGFVELTSQNLYSYLEKLIHEAPSIFYMIADTLNRKGFTQPVIRIEPGKPSMYCYITEVNNNKYYLHLYNGVIGYGRIINKGDPSCVKLGGFSNVDDVVNGYISMIENTEIENAASILTNMKSSNPMNSGLQVKNSNPAALKRSFAMVRLDSDQEK